MSTIKTDALTSVTTNTDLTLSANGTGGVKVSDYFQLTKGADISSATSLTLGTDGNAFDITGTTTITSIATQGIGSHVTLHFDGALTFTHHSTDLILPGAANITTAAGDIAVMYEYASADWRCISYTKASGAAVVAASAGFTLATPQTPTSGTGVTFGSIPAGTRMIVIQWFEMFGNNDGQLEVELGDSGGLETSGYRSKKISLVGTGPSDSLALTDAFHVGQIHGPDGDEVSGQFILTLVDSSNNHWVGSGTSARHTNATIHFYSGSKSLSGELTQVALKHDVTSYDGGTINILYQ